MKMTILPEAIYRFNAISLKILISYFIKIEKNLQMYMEAQKIKDRQSILIKNNTAGGFQIMP